MSLLSLYRAATWAALPIARGLIDYRTRKGKEDPERRGERFGAASRERPDGALIWCHAASVGEAVSLLSLIDRLLERAPAAHVLVTSGTVTSAGLLERRLPANAFHQYVPLDLPGAVGRFLDYWRPDLALWVESELWPNLILETRRRGIPMALLNARMSVRSAKAWGRIPSTIRPLLACFDLVLAQDPAQAARLAELGAVGAHSVGDLKSAAAPLPTDETALTALRRAANGRPLWLAASTHEGEEEIVATAHAMLAAKYPNLLTILAPRHPGRSERVAELLAEHGLVVARRSKREPLVMHTSVYLVDVLGEMGLFYRLSRIVLVAGSLAAPGTMGGHNPMEAALLGAAILHGPDMVNAAANTAMLDQAGAARYVGDAAELAAAVDDLLANPAKAEAMGEAASALAEADRQVLDHVMAALMPLIARLPSPPEAEASKAGSPKAGATESGAHETGTDESHARA